MWRNIVKSGIIYLTDMEELLMKKIVVILILLLFISGCAGESKELDSYQEEKIKEKSEVEKFISNQGLRRYEFNCEISTEKIKDFSLGGDMFLTDDGKLYEWSLNLFSNGTNCKKVETDVRFKRFINNVIVNEHGEIYTYIDRTLKKGKGDGIAYELYESNNDMFLFSQNYSGSIFHGFDPNHHYAVLKENPDVLINYVYKNSEWVRDDVFGIVLVNEKITHTYNNYFKTDKSYYYHSVINREECDKYVDVECEFGIVKMKELNKIFEELHFFGPAGFIILKSEQNVIYSNQMGG